MNTKNLIISSLIGGIVIAVLANIPVIQLSIVCSVPDTG